MREDCREAGPWPEPKGQKDPPHTQGPEQVGHSRWRQCVLKHSLGSADMTPAAKKNFKYKIGLKKTLLSSISHWFLSCDH